MARRLLPLFLIAWFNHISGLYKGDECLQSCPDFFEKYSAKENQFQDADGESIAGKLQQFLADEDDTGIFDDRCAVNLFNFAYQSGVKLTDTPSIAAYKKTLDSETKRSPYFCFADLHGVTRETQQAEPRWDGLKVKSDICDKMSLMELCNLYWPCAVNGLKSICDWRGVFNCETKRCECFLGFANTSVRERPEDAFISCDIGIRALFNSLHLPPIHDDFIEDATYKEFVIKPSKYKVPKAARVRVFAQAYLTQEFNEIVADVNHTVASAEKRKSYLPFNSSAALHEQNSSSLIIGISMQYVDLEAAVDHRIKHLSDLQQQFFDRAPLAPTLHITRSNEPGWLAINGHGIYHIGDHYWNTPSTEGVPAAGGLAYIAAMNVKWYSSFAKLQFEQFGKVRILSEFADKMKISFFSISSNNFRQIDRTETDNFPLLLEANIVIATENQEAIAYFKEKKNSKAELSPPSDEDGAIKSVLRQRRAAIKERVFGGFIAAQLDFPTSAGQSAAALNETAMLLDLQTAFSKVLKTKLRYVAVVKAADNSHTLNISIFDPEHTFKLTYDALQDDENVQHALLTNTRHLQQWWSFNFSSWQVLSGPDWLAAWYELCLYANPQEISSKDGIQKDASLTQWLDAFRSSLFNGLGGLGDKQGRVEYFQLHPTVGYQYSVEIQIAAKFLSTLQKVQNAGMTELDKCSLESGYAMLAAAAPDAVDTRVSVFASLFLGDISTNDALLYAHDTINANHLVSVLKDLLRDTTIDANAIDAEVDIIDTNVDQHNTIEITMEFYFPPKFEANAKRVLRKLQQHAAMVQSINDQAFEKGYTFSVKQIRLTAAGELAISLHDLMQARTEVVEAQVESAKEFTANFSHQANSVFHKFVNQYSMTLLPIDVFCSEFYTPLSFGTLLKFGYLKQYMCVQVTDVIPGKNGKVMLKSKLTFKAKSPGAPDTLVSLCDYLQQSAANTDGEMIADAAKEEQIKQSGPGLIKLCALYAAGEELVPNVGDSNVVAALIGGQLEIMQLPDMILDDPRPNPKYPYEEMLRAARKEAVPSKQNNTNETRTEEVYKTKSYVDAIPPDAYVVVAGVAVFVVLKVMHRMYKRRKSRLELAKQAEDDMSALRNIAKMSKLTADEYKLVYEKAKEKVKAMDFSAFQKRKKRKHEWEELEEFERTQKRKKQKQVQRKTNDAVNEDDDSEAESSVNLKKKHTDFYSLFEAESTVDSYTDDF